MNRIMIEAYQAAIIAIAKRGTLKDARYDVSAAEREATGESLVYKCRTDLKAAFVAYCHERIAILVNADHAEALAMNAAHDEERLNREYRNTMTGIEEMNKAKAKQQQTPEQLPKDQMVDVVRAALRTMPATQDQIDNVANLTQYDLRKLIISMTGKGARVTAHLTKSKSCGYGFLTFGYNGQLPPGTYHKLVVSGMKNAREVANRYGAMMWNF